jgi:hypothetical protein
MNLTNPTDPTDPTDLTDLTDLTDPKIKKAPSRERASGCGVEKRGL